MDLNTVMWGAVVF